MKPVIIIVDKKPFLPDTLEMVISNYYPQQFTILAFNSTTPAFNIIEELLINKETISLIICNSQMPNLSGYEFLNLVNAICPNCTKVLFTTYIKLKEYRDLLAGNIIDFILEKPFNTNSLINIIQCSIKQQHSLLNAQKNSDTIQSLKNSLSTLRSKYQVREQTLLSISNSLNAFYFKLNFKNSLLDIYSSEKTIFGYDITTFNNFDSFLSIVDKEDQHRLIESIKKIKVVLTKQDKIYFKIMNSDKEIIQVKTLLISEEVDNISGTESVIGLVQNVSSELLEYEKVTNQVKQ